MTQYTNDCFARIAVVDSRFAGRVLNPWNLILFNLLGFGLVVVFGLLWCLLLAVTGYSLSSVVGVSPTRSAALASLLVVVGYAAFLFLCHGFTYPEWPLNQVFCGQLRRSIARRSAPSRSSCRTDSRVVELVPRSRWNKKLCLDSATDLMTLQIDTRGVWMQGDRHDYELPAESILGVELERSRPPGSYPLYRVTIYVRTESGTVELSVSHRDYRWGALRSSRRLDQATDLAEQIKGIAKGHHYRPLQSPIVEPPSRAPLWSDNPYAPAM